MEKLERSKAEGEAIGKAEGIAEGKVIGKRKELVTRVCKKMKLGQSLEKIAVAKSLLVSARPYPRNKAHVICSASHYTENYLK